jgi:hypothetical protein
MKVLALLLIVAFPVLGRAQFTYITNNGAIIITGYTGPGGAVVVPAETNGYPVLSIGNSAFLNCSNLTSILLPEGLSNIDVQAFTDCGLTNIIIPDSVTNIGQSAFLNCSSLTGVTIGKSVVTIADDAFCNCPGLTNIFIPAGVTNLFPTAFEVCSNLFATVVDAQNPAYSSLAGVLFNKNATTLVTFPDGLFGSYTIPGTVTSIGDYAFHMRFLTNVIIPDGVTNIGQYAFSECRNLSSVVLPTNLITVGQYAFSGTGLTNVFIPAGVTNIGLFAFDCPNLIAFTVAANNPAYTSVMGILFNSNQTGLLEFPIGKLGTLFHLRGYAISNGVTFIGDGAFGGCYLLSNITIPASVTRIGNMAFLGCPYLTNIIIPNGVTNIGNSAFDSTGVTNLTIPASVTTLGWLDDVSHLRSIYFLGNAPALPPGNLTPAVLGLYATAYYLPGTTGWGPYFQNPYIVTALWLPQMQTLGANPGLQTNPFTFEISWTSNQTVVVEAATTLVNPVWTPLATNTLIANSSWFNDSQWSNFPARFYRLRSP